MKHVSIFKALSVPVALALCIFTSVTARADTYQVFQLNSDRPIPYGIDDSGDVVLEDFTVNCGGHNPCFDTYVSGQLVDVSSTAPLLAYDNGTPCSIPGAVVGPGVTPRCNNGRELFTAPEISGPGRLLTGTPTDLVQISDEEGIFGLINSLGDVVAVNGAQGYTYEYLDVTSRVGVTPEPSTLALLGSGMFGIAAMMRRKLLSI
ncbi:PEP-CTERM sorting domain-containing protein [Tunturiibacter gelidiferens]|uniref:PEP-CTERM sorting domain-containing protein n=1 Tax=Tunturiibacter gelidiferens TaxID=3069689 RepID=UPI003D9B7698